MKTNVKSSRSPLALALITTEHFSIDYYYRNQHHCLDSSSVDCGLNSSIECKIQSVLSRIDVDCARVIIILSSQLTLYSQLVFPADLSDAQIADLVNLQLANRDNTDRISTFYDYFQLKATSSACTFALIEARKDQIHKWMNVLQANGLDTVAVLSQPLIFINYMIKNTQFSKQDYYVVCILSSRFIVACVEQSRVQSITEHTYSSTSSSDELIINMILQQLQDAGDEQNQPVMLLDTVGDDLGGNLPDNFSRFPGFKKEKVLGENTFVWLRSENDMYQSVTLA